MVNNWASSAYGLQLTPRPQSTALPITPEGFPLAPYVQKLCSTETRAQLLLVRVGGKGTHNLTVFQSTGLSGWEGRTGEHEVAEMQQLPPWLGVVFSSLQGLGCPETRSPSNGLFLSTTPSSRNVCIQTLTLIHCLRVFNHLDKYACKIFPRCQAIGTKHSVGLKKRSRISLLGPTTKPVKHKATARISKVRR